MAVFYVHWTIPRFFFLFQSFIGSIERIGEVSELQTAGSNQESPILVLMNLLLRIGGSRFEPEVQKTLE